jgi:hypothetical protein
VKISIYSFGDSRVFVLRLADATNSEYFEMHAGAAIQPVKPLLVRLYAENRLLLITMGLSPFSWFWQTFPAVLTP